MLSLSYPTLHLPRKPTTPHQHDYPPCTYLNACITIALLNTSHLHHIHTSHTHSMPHIMPHIVPRIALTSHPDHTRIALHPTEIRNGIRSIRNFGMASTMSTTTRTILCTWKQMATLDVSCCLPLTHLIHHLAHTSNPPHTCLISLCAQYLHIHGRSWISNIQYSHFEAEAIHTRRSQQAHSTGPTGLVVRRGAHPENPQVDSEADKGGRAQEEWKDALHSAPNEKLCTCKV